MTQVVVYNAGASGVTDADKRESFKLHTKSLKHAIKMLERGVAVPMEWVEGENFGPHPLVTAVELVTYVYTKWVYHRTGRVIYSKAGVLRRDKFRCAYCPKRGTTIDHVLPKSRGGKSEWMNCVAACASCNERKADQTPHEAGMVLRFTPFVPTFEDINPYHVA